MSVFLLLCHIFCCSMYLYIKKIVYRRQNSMTKKQNQIKKSNTVFICLNIVMIFALFLAIGIDIVNKITHFICIYDDSFVEAIGIGSQIIAAIVACVLSIIGISFSLQGNSFFGVAIRDLNAMRKRYRYPTSCIFIIAIALLFAAIISYSFKCMISCIGISIVAIIFCLYVLILELPILIQNEKAFISILKDRFIYAYNNGKEDMFQSDDYIREKFDIALSDLLGTKTLKTVYGYFSIKDEPEYNKTVLLKLLDVQQKIVFKNSSEEYKVVTDSLKSSILDIFYGSFDVVQVLGDDFKQYKHYFTRILYRLIVNEKDYYDNTANSIARAFVGIYGDINKDNNKLLVSIMLVLNSSLIKNNCFALLEALKKEYTRAYFVLPSKSASTLAFAIISMHLYYLSRVEEDLPKEIKDSIIHFVNTEYVQDNRLALSWKSLFKSFISGYAIDYEEYIRICNENWVYFDFMLDGPFAKTVLFTTEFLNDWYICMLLNSNRAYRCDFSKELHYLTEGNYVYYLEHFVNKNFKEDVFYPCASLNDMTSFYLEENSFFQPVKVKSVSKAFYDYYCSLKINMLEEKANNDARIDNEDVKKKLKEPIIKKLEADVCFKSNSGLNKNKQKYISIRYEKESNAFNHEDFLINYIVDGVFYDIAKSISIYCQEIKRDSNYETNIRKLQKKNITMITPGAKAACLYINDTELQQSFQRKLDNAKEIDSRILLGTYAIIDDGCKYSINVDDFSIRDLDEKEINEEIDRYLREDGQYVYEGLFLPREEIRKLIDKKYMIVTIVFRYEVEIESGCLIKIDL